MRFSSFTSGVRGSECLQLCNTPSLTSKSKQTSQKSVIWNSEEPPRGMYHSRENFAKRQSFWNAEKEVDVQNNRWLLL